jgi:hypothetical protein
MSLNSLKIATSGYLKRGTKAALVIAVAGYLNFNDVPPTPTQQSGDGFRKSEAYKNKEDWQERIKLDDDLVFHVIKIWLEKCQT